MKLMTPRGTHPRASNRRTLTWLFLLVGLLSLPPLIYSLVAEDSAQELRYGQFKKKLAAGEILSVKVGPAALTGLFRPRDSKTAPVRFHTSRMGMEQDPDLPRLLDTKVPEGAYEAENGPSVSETVVAPWSSCVPWWWVLASS